MHVVPVVAMGADEEVVGIDAAGVVAVVADKLVLAQVNTGSDFVGQAMGLDLALSATGTADDAVAVLIDGALPVPAAIARRLDVAPEALVEGSAFAGRVQGRRATTSVPRVAPRVSSTSRTPASAAPSFEPPATSSRPRRG